MYTSLEHYIDGNWVKPTGQVPGRHQPVQQQAIGELGHASKGDLDKALAAVDKGFKTWRKVSAFERGKILRKAADLLRTRADEIAKVLTQEQGKILAEAKMEVSAAPTSSTGSPGKASAPTAASSRRAPTACATW